MADPRLTGADPDCLICGGRGSLIADEKIIEGEYWCAFVDCDCTIVPISEAQRSYINAAFGRALKEPADG